MAEKSGGASPPSVNTTHQAPNKTTSQENASCKELDKLEPFAPSTNVNRTTGAGPLPNTSTYEDFMEKFDYMDHSKATSNLVGLEAPPEKSINVMFHVIVPKPLWEWNESSCIHIRFGHKDLGNWICNIGEFTETRSKEDGSCEMICGLNIARDLLKAPIEYKYVIFSPKMKTEQDCYEFLHSFSKMLQNSNRCISITGAQGYESFEVCYHQYDMYTFPQVAMSQKILKAVKARLKFPSDLTSDPNQFIHFTKEELATRSLYFYLQPYKELLLNIDARMVNSIIRVITHIFAMILKPAVKNFTENIKELSSNMTKWLENIVQKLHQETRENCKFLSTVCIACCLKKCDNNFSLKKESMEYLLESLRLQPDVKRKECLQYSWLCECFDPCFRKAIGDAIFHLCQETAKAGMVKWLFVWPLYNFLINGRSPFMEPNYEPKDIMFQDNFPPLPAGYVVEHYEEVAPLFSADPILLHLFIGICPREDYLGLFTNIPTYLALTFVSHLSVKVQYVNKDEANEWMRWLQRINDRMGKNQHEPVIEATVKAALLMFKCLATKLVDYNKYYLDIVLISLTIVLLSFSKFDQFSREGNQTSACVDKAAKTLLMWLKNVIGVSVFGGENGKYSEELEIWHSVLTLEIQSTNITQLWTLATKPLIEERIKGVGVQALTLVCLLEKKESFHHVLSDIIMESASQAIDKLSSRINTSQVDDLVSTDSGKLGLLFGRLLQNQYPQLKSKSTVTISLDDLLNWAYWSIFLKIQKSTTKMKEGLPLECQEACKCALNQFEMVCTQLEKKSITLMDLQKIMEKVGQMKKLCRAANAQQMTTGISVDGPIEMPMITTIHQRICEFNLFKKQQGILLHLCQMIHASHGLEGIPEATNELNKCFNSYEIRNLYHQSGDSIEVTCYKAASCLKPFALHFYTLTQEYNSAIFHSIWNKILDNAQCSSINDVGPRLWQPAFEECQKLLKELKNASITLGCVERRFHEYKEDPEKLKEDLTMLSSGMSICLKIRRNPTWISTTVARIKNYWRLWNCREAANTFLKLRDTLKLTRGDFVHVEWIFEEVTSSLKVHTLANIDNIVLDIVEFLSTFAGIKLMCIKKFIQCQNIVQWIKETTIDVRELQDFVTVALATSSGGKDDHTQDKLSNLRTVASGFGPLIYNLKEDTGFSVLTQRCTFIWEVLKKNPCLPNMLVDCNKDLQWYKSIKDTQGSVELTTFSQMKNILVYGHYVVKTMQSNTTQSAHDIICLKLKGGTQLLKKSYSMEELRDLESKLVLITGSKAENRAEVDHFLDTLNCVRRIAEVLIFLQREGNARFIKWKMKFPCRPFLVRCLEQQASEMEMELEKWRRYLKQARYEFYEMNYFTNDQVLALRCKLGKLKENGTKALSPYDRAQVMALLQSISCVVTETDEHAVETIVQEATKSVNHDNDFISTSVKPVYQIELTSTETAIDSSEKKGTTKHSSEVTDLIDDHDPKKMEALTNLTVKYRYPKDVVLKAIKELNTSDHYKLLGWIKKHHHQTIGDESSKEIEEESSDEEEKEDEEGEISSSGDCQMFQNDESPPQVQSKGNSMIIYKEIVDEDHKEVQKLISAGFSKEKSIQGIKRWDTARAALLHVDVQHSNGVFGPEEANDTPVQCNTEMKKYIIVYENIGGAKGYLTLKELGVVLQQLSSKLHGAVLLKRFFCETSLKSGQPNLLLVAPEDVLKIALSLYMGDGDCPLPTLEEMVICNENTTVEEVELLWQRAVFDGPDFKRVFCLVHAEKLPHQISDKIIRSLVEIIQAKSGYRLVIICSNPEEGKCHIISKLYPYRRSYGVPFDIDNCRKYLRNHFISEKNTLEACKRSGLYFASAVDQEMSCVRVVSSTRAGMGKSLYIARMADQLQKYKSDGKVIVTVPIHGPHVTPDTVIKCLEIHQVNSFCTIIHFDIDPSVLWQVDTILFSLLVQKGLCDSQGRVWRCHPSQLYAIEVTLPDVQEESINHTIPERFTMAVLDMLPSVRCIKPKKVFKHIIDTSQGAKNIVLMDDYEFGSPAYQRVYLYLVLFYIGNEMDQFSFTNNKDGSQADFLKRLLHYCGIEDPSWAELRHFIYFLNQQLESCEQSVFTREVFTGDILAGLKTFVVKFMIRMSRDFSTSSLRGEVEKENEKTLPDHGKDKLEQYQIVERKQWELSSHPYLFFNQDRTSLTFVGFRVTSDGDLKHPDHKGILEKSIMTSKLYTGLKSQGVNFEEDYQNWSKKEMIQKMCTMMGLKEAPDPDETYVLTVDNLIKIFAIQMRFRCGIPVVIMGETGCGKTRLIRFMCDLIAKGTGKRNIFIMKVHGGIREEDIVQFLQKVQTHAETNRKQKLDTLVFFDEANTTDSVGLIKEIMCDRRLHGNPIPADIKFIAACNPYRRHSIKMIMKLRSAGLGFFVKERDTQQRLGKIPLRELVYRVVDLPPSMRPLVYDFGQLNPDKESNYIFQIVSGHVEKDFHFPKTHSAVVRAVGGVLAWSQKYMRERMDECSFVSLRDVERAMIVLKYFYEKMSVFGPLMNKKEQNEQQKTEKKYESLGIKSSQVISSRRSLTRALILALSVCYHARLSERDDYECNVSIQFTKPLLIPGGVEQFRNEIRLCQEVLLDSMELGSNIARNAALRENIFMMAVCVDLRIPLFLVGKPGSSKSLAKAIVCRSMQGQASSSKLLKSFKEVHMFSYQCSQLSTSESIIEVFNTAKKFQQKQDTSKYVSVVVLDEVGLAEDSPNLPLKALHPLLEDGTEGADSLEMIDREKRVAFIGISNWALDPAKMNRGVMVTRSDPSAMELVLSAEGICSNKESDSIVNSFKRYFQPLAEAYNNICDKQERQFFGLRDFYSLIKMLYWMCAKTRLPLTGPQLLHAINRNFGGLEGKNVNPVQEFEEKLPNTIFNPPDLSNVRVELHHYLNPDNSRLGLIKSSLRTKDKTWHGENRYLLFLTENYAALEILNEFSQDHEKEFSRMGERSLQVVKESTVSPCEMEPFILFGSSFPKDKDYTQVCRNINQVKICMETGRTVILLNLETVYESLYDLLNQYYIYFGGNKYVDLGLQTHKVKCRVHEEFKLILIAEKTIVYEKFRTALINRLEKHFVLASSILEDWQSEVLAELQEWVEKFSNVSDSNNSFKEEDAFVGYHKETAATVVVQASNQLRKCVNKLSRTPYLWEVALDQGLLHMVSRDELKHVKKDSERWKNAVLAISQFLLLQTTHPAALFRLQESRLNHQFDRLGQLYYLQHHSSIDDFLCYFIKQDSSKGFLMQVTTHSHLLSHNEVTELGKQLRLAGRNVVSLLLHEFDTAQGFISSISPLFSWREEESQNGPHLLIIQCDFDHVDGNLIAYARYRIYDERAKALLKAGGRVPHPTHVLFIIHIPVHAIHSSFVGFQGYHWESSHIDELRKNSEGGYNIKDVQGKSISGFFYRTPEVCRDTSLGLQEEILEADTTVVQQTNIRKFHSQCTRLNSCIQAALSTLQGSTHNMKRDTKRVRILMDLIPTEPDFPLDPTSFYGILVGHIYRLLKEREELLCDSNWVCKEAMKRTSLRNGGTFKNVLARRLDHLVKPIFAEVIAFIDSNCNLNFLQPGDSSTPLSHLWLKIFCCPGIEHKLSYQRMKTKQKVLIEEFEGQFPFSWLVKEAIDNLWEEAKAIAGSSRQNLWQQLADLVIDSNVGKTLQSVSQNDCGEMYRRYLHDFVSTVHKCTHGEKEIVMQENEIIWNTIHNLIIQGSMLNSANGQMPLNKWITAVHIVYNSVCEELHWFGQLTSLHPGIVSILASEDVQMTEEGMVLHINAVLRVLDSLEPPIEYDRDSTESDIDLLGQWIGRLQPLCNIIDSTLSLTSQHSLAYRARCKWHRIRAVQMFTEHVVLRHKKLNTVPFSRQLLILLGEEPDFLTCSIVKGVRNILNLMSDAIQKEDLKADKVNGHIFIFNDSCQRFFTEMLSVLCFGQSTAPEDELVEMLLGIIFPVKERRDGSERSITKDLTFSKKKKKRDDSPVIRSSLLQLLLEHKTESVKRNLKQYFKQSKQTLGSADVDVDLCLLCTQCFEDALDKKLSSQTFSTQLHEAIDLLHGGLQSLERVRGGKRSDARKLQSVDISGELMQQHISLDLLEGVANIRYGLFVVAKLLLCQVNKVDGAFLSNNSDIISIAANQLVDKAQYLCAARSVNAIDITGHGNTTGPAVYLLKLIVRLAGFGELNKVADKHQWVIPESLRCEEDNTVMDPFMVYSHTYSSLRKAIRLEADHGQVFPALKQALQHLKSQESVPLLLGLYKVVTLSHASTLPSNRPLQKVLKNINTQILEVQVLSKKLKAMAQMLINNKQGGPLDAFRVSPGQLAVQRTAGTVVVHTAAVLLSMTNVTLLQPLISMITNPADLTKAYLPTMPEDEVAEARKAMLVGVNQAKGRFYECPRGHPYFVGECGLPMVKQRCNVCGSIIGGLEHTKVADNKQRTLRDTTQTGHCLGHPMARSLSPERSLSPTSCNILRAIMHSALIWASCNTEGAINSLKKLVKMTGSRAGCLPEYFWGHLERDLELVGQALGKNVEEAAILVHLVIKSILTTNPSFSGPAEMFSSLVNRDARHQWENFFNKTYIQPVLERVDANISSVMEAISKYDHHDQNKVFSLVYEKVPVVGKSLEPHLWRYRVPISLPHLSRALEQQEKGKYPILHEFLKDEPILRATQYIPDIVQLQQKLFCMFHHRQNKKDARGKTIGQFILKEKSGQIDKKLAKLVSSLQVAWSLVWDKLKDHARLHVDDQYLLPAITMDTTLDYLVPTMTGPGACTFALVDFLVLAHNNFIERCRSLVADSGREWLEHKVPLPYTHRCHLLDYEQKLHSVILSHCHYSLKAGQSCEASYDFPLLEKHILDHFILGRPQILVDIPEVVYCQDMYTTATFAAIRDKVQQQVPLPSQVQRDILQELRSPDLLRKSLDVVDIIIGFLTSGGGRPKTPLTSYLTKLKMQKRAFSAKAKEHCRLEHILSLWLTLSVGLAKMVTHSKQDPFDHIPNCLKEKLSDTQERNLDQCLRQCNLDSLLRTLYEYIETTVRLIDTNSPEEKWGIVMVIQVLDMDVAPDIEKLPEDIIQSQAVMLWKYIVLFQDTLTKE